MTGYEFADFSKDDKARHTDPETSHDAAPTSPPRISQKMIALVAISQHTPNGLTDTELRNHYFPGKDRGIVASLRGSSVKEGYVQWTGRKRMGGEGKEVNVYEVTPTGWVRAAELAGLGVVAEYHAVIAGGRGGERCL